MTALHSAASNGSYDVCDTLLQHGADFRCRDEEDMTPLHFAAMEGHTGKYCSFSYIFIDVKEWWRSGKVSVLLCLRSRARSPLLS